MATSFQDPIVSRRRKNVESLLSQFPEIDEATRQKVVDVPGSSGSEDAAFRILQSLPIDHESKIALWDAWYYDKPSIGMGDVQASPGAKLPKPKLPAPPDEVAQASQVQAKPKTSFDARYEAETGTKPRSLQNTPMMGPKLPTQRPVLPAAPNQAAGYKRFVNESGNELSAFPVEGFTEITIPSVDSSGRQLSERDAEAAYLAIRNNAKPQPHPTLGAKLKHAAATAARVFGTLPADIAESVAMMRNVPYRPGGGQFAEELSRKLATGPISSDPLYAGAQDTRERVESAFPINPDLADSFWWSAVPQGLASLGTTIIGGMAGGGAGAILVGSSQMANQAYKEALEKTGDPKTATKAWAFNALVGLTEAIPAMDIIKRANRMRNGIGKILVDAGLDAAEEGIQEGIQQFLTNVDAAKISGYDISRPLSKDVLINMAAGSVTGAIAGGAMGTASAIDARRQGRQEVTQPAAVPPVAPPAPITPSPTMSQTWGGKTIAGVMGNQLVFSDGTVEDRPALHTQRLRDYGFKEMTLPQVQELAAKAAPVTPGAGVLPETGIQRPDEGWTQPQPAAVPAVATETAVAAETAVLPAPPISEPADIQKPVGTAEEPQVIKADQGTKDIGPRWTIGEHDLSDFGEDWMPVAYMDGTSPEDSNGVIGEKDGQFRVELRDGSTYGPFDTIEMAAATAESRVPQVQAGESGVAADGQPPATLKPQAAIQGTAEFLVDNIPVTVDAGLGDEVEVTLRGESADSVRQIARKALKEAGLDPAEYILSPIVITKGTFVPGRGGEANPEHSFTFTKIAKTQDNIQAASTGKPFTAKLLRGEGTKTSPYSDRSAGVPILGEAFYLTDDRKYAEAFGPNITEHEVTLQNPLVISSDSQWRKLTDAAGWEFPNPTGLDSETAKAGINKLRETLESQGYDGVVIKLSDPRYGDQTKTMWNVFGANQVIQFKEKTKEEPPTVLNVTQIRSPGLIGRDGPEINPDEAGKVDDGILRVFVRTPDQNKAVQLAQSAITESGKKLAGYERSPDIKVWGKDKNVRIVEFKSLGKAFIEGGRGAKLPNQPTEETIATPKAELPSPPVETPAVEQPGKFRVEVIADDSGKWAGSSKTYATQEEAQAAADDLRSRWMAVRETRVVPVEEEEAKPELPAAPEQATETKPAAADDFALKPFTPKEDTATVTEFKQSVERMAASRAAESGNPGLRREEAEYMRLLADHLSEDSVNFNDTYGPAESTDKFQPTTNVSADERRDIESNVIDAWEIAEEKAEAAKPKKPPMEVLAERVRDAIKAGQSIDNPTLTKWANEAFGGTRGEGKFDPKMAYDAAEAGINMAIREPGIVDFNDVPGTLKRLRAMVSRMPTQADRTAEQQQLQQFSTPPEEAFTVAFVSGLKPGMIGLEPSAGNGGIAIMGEAAGATMITNELSARRKQVLESLGFSAHSVDAEHLDALLDPSIRPDVVVMNPPFSSSAKGKTNNTEHGAKHVTQALNRIKPGGRLVAVVGRGMAHDRPSFMDWWNKIEAKYNVRANIGIDGKYYQKYGTGFDNQIIVIDKTGPTPGDTRSARLANIIRADALSPEQAIELLTPLSKEDVRGRIQQASGTTSEQTIRPQSAPGRKPGARPNITGAPRGERTDTAPTEQPGTKPGGVGELGNTPAGPPAIITPSTGGRPGRLPSSPAESQATAGLGGTGGVADAGQPERVPGGRPGLAPTPAEKPKGGFGSKNTFKTAADAEKAREKFRNKARGTNLSAGIDPELMQAAFDLGAYYFEGGIREIGAWTKAMVDDVGETVRPYLRGAFAMIEDTFTEEETPKEQQQPEETPEEDNAVFSKYIVRKAKFPDSVPHPAHMVESATMSSVEPPNVTYRPDLPEEVIKEGRLSDVQLEAITYAGQRHQTKLPNGQTAAFWIGDGCVAAGTRIYNPVTRSHSPIERLVKEGKSHVVLSLTRDGLTPTMAYVPFQKGIADLYRVTVSDGRKITVTGEHRFLSENGWMTIDAGLHVGSQIACVDGPAARSLGFHSIRDGNDQSSKRRPEDCLDDCSADLRRYDARLPLGGDIYQEFAPLRAYVPEHIQTSSQMDDLETSLECTDACRFSSHRSRSSSSPSAILDHVGTGVLAGAFSSLSSADSHPIAAQSQSWNNEDELAESIRIGLSSPHLPHSVGQAFDEGCRASSDNKKLFRYIDHGVYQERPYHSHLDILGKPEVGTLPSEAHGNYSEWLSVVSIKFVRRDVYYDMYVPGPENYVAEGMIHHNTGVGKGRTASGIILDNLQKGKKRALWLSVGQQLAVDAKRDLEGVGVPMDFIKQMDAKMAESIPDKDGVLFSTYGMAADNWKAGKERFNQIADWLGSDFDGVIIMDEGHKMKGAMGTTVGGAVTAKAGTDNGAMGLELSKVFPNAKIVYVSATGATIARNMAYMDRLGLWGAGAPFRGFMDFLGAMDAGGVGAMEMLARDLKATGAYISRTLSFDGVDYDTVVHDLTDTEKSQYNKMSAFWSELLSRFEEAMANANQPKSAGREMNAFYATQQRFFLQVMTSLQLPDMFSEAAKDLKAGRSIIISLINTNEGHVKRKVNEAIMSGSDMTDIDLTPRDALKDLIEKYFPTQEYELVHNPITGQDESRPMVHPDGRPVLNPENVAMKEAMLDKLKDISVPENPLDAIVAHFGAEKVSEISGRKKRFEYGKYVNRKIPGVKVQNRDEAEIKRFQDGTTRVAIITAKGSTGISLHADKGAKNKQRRVMYAMQLSWSADQQMQTTPGRAHRAFQDSAPILKLFRTNLKGQERLVNTVSARLASLGAISKGGRETLGGGIFGVQDLTDKYGSAALMRTYRSLINDQPISGVTNGRDALKRMGVLNADGQIKDGRVDDVNGFLNRIMSLPFHEQNAIFDDFYQNYTNAVETAKSQGVFDVGVHKIEGENFRKIGESETVYTHPDSGAKTELVQLEGDMPLHPVDWQRSKSWAENGYFVNNRSSRLYAARAWQAEEDGNTIWNVQLTAPTGKRHVVKVRSLTEFSENFTEQRDPQKRWTDEFEKAPKFETEQVYILTGAIYPIYNRVMGGAMRSWNARVVRATLADGKTSYVGLEISPDAIVGLKQRMGIGTALGGATGQRIYDLVRGGSIIELDNGWKIKNTKIHNEPRIEVDTRSGGANQDEMRDHGTFEETIDYRRRYFIPIGDDGPGVLDSILNLHAAVRDETSSSGESGSYGMSSVPPPLTPTSKTSTGQRATAGPPPPIAPSAAAAVQNGPLDRDDIIGKREILADLTKRLNVPLRTGRFFQRALGIFKVKKNVARTKGALDLEVAAHEIGHALNKLLWGTSGTQGISLNYRPLKPYASELTPIATKPRAGQSPIPEGFAEFVRMYLNHPAQALQVAPRFYAFFGAELQNNPAVESAMKDAQRNIKRYKDQEPGQRILSQIAMDSDDEAPTMGRWDTFYSQVFDRFHIVKKLLDPKSTLKTDDDPYQLLRLFAGWSGKATRFIEHDTFDPDTLQSTGKSLKAILEPVKDSLDELRIYLLAARARELNARGIESGLDINDANAEYSRLNGKFGPVAAELYDYQNKLVDYMVGRGVLSRSQAVAMRMANQNYVPFYRMWEATVGEGETAKPSFGVGDKYNDLYSPIHRIKGSQRQIVDPIKSILLNTYAFINVAERNLIGNALVSAAAKIPDSGWLVESVPAEKKPVSFNLNQITKNLVGLGVELDGIDLDELATIFVSDARASSKDNVMAILVNGDRKLFQIQPDLYKALSLMDEETVNTIVRWIAKPARLLRAGATGLSPEFGIRNIARDQFNAAMVSNYGYFPPRDIFAGLGHVLRRDDLYREWMSSGGAHAAMVSMDRKNLQKKLNELMRNPIGNAILHPIDALRVFSEISEEVTRVGEYALAKRKGATIKEAAMSSREVSTDFARRGSKTLALSMITAFWNANMQGVDLTIRTHKAHPMRTFMRGFLGITVPSMLIYLLNRDNPEYEELRRGSMSWLGDLFWLIPTDDDIPLPDWWVNMAGHFFPLPKPHLFGLIYGSIPERFMEWIDKKDPEAMDGLAGTLLRQVPWPLPTGLVPAIESFANRSIYTGRPIVPQKLLKFSPEFQYQYYTSEFAKLNSEWLASIGLHYSPMMIDNAMFGYSGGAGRLMMDVLDRPLGAMAGRNEVPRPSKTAADRPILRALTVRFPSAGLASIQKFYNRLNDLETRMADVRETRLKAKPITDAEARELQILRQYDKSMDDLQAEINRLVASNEDGDTKKRKITAVEYRVLNVARMAIDRVKNKTFPGESAQPGSTGPARPPILPKSPDILAEYLGTSLPAPPAR